MNLSRSLARRSVHAMTVIGLSLAGAAVAPSLVRAQDPQPSTPELRPYSRARCQARCRAVRQVRRRQAVQPAEVPVEAPPAVQPVLLTGTPAAICAKLAAKDAGSIEERDREAVSKLYQARECRPLWVDEQGALARHRLSWRNSPMRRSGASRRRASNSRP